MIRINNISSNMKQLSSHFRNLLALILISCGPILINCGGGTTGTGDFDSARVEGRVIDLSGAPLIDAQVTIPETGNFTFTDNDGNFEINAAFTTPEISLVVVSSTLNAAVSLGAAPANGTKLTVEVLADKEHNTITIITSEGVPNVPPTGNNDSSAGGSNSSNSNSSSAPGDGLVPATPTPTSGDPAPPAETPTPTPTPGSVGSIYRGTILGRAKGTPFTQATVRVQLIGDSDITDSEGQFYIATSSIGGGDVVLEVSKNGYTKYVTIPNVPSGDIIATLDLEFYTPQNPGVGEFEIDLLSAIYSDRSDGD